MIEVTAIANTPRSSILLLVKSSWWKRPYCSWLKSLNLSENYPDSIEESVSWYWLSSEAFESDLSVVQREKTSVPSFSPENKISEAAIDSRKVLPRSFQISWLRTTVSFMCVCKNEKSSMCRQYGKAFPFGLIFNASCVHHKRIVVIVVGQDFYINHSGIVFVHKQLLG